MKNKIVTVFGGTGFIGKYVIDELVKAGYTIRVISRSLERAKNLRTGAYVGQIVPVAGDLNMPENFAQLIEGSYAVVNLVGVLFESGKQNFERIHHQNAGKLATAAKKAGVEKFVHLSAIVAENSSAKYAVTKIAGEMVIQNAFPDSVILKPSVVFGAEDNFFNKFAKMAVFSPILPLIGKDTKFQPVYVGDVAKAVLAAVNGAKSGTYQLAGPQSLTFKDILLLVEKYINRKRFLLNIPFCVAKVIAFFSPAFVLTRDQVELLKQDNVASTKSKGLKELGITPTAIDAVVPEYLARFRKKAPK